MQKGEFFTLGETLTNLNFSNYHTTSIYLQQSLRVITTPHTGAGLLTWIVEEVQMTISLSSKRFFAGANPTHIRLIATVGE